MKYKNISIVLPHRLRERCNAVFDIAYDRHLAQVLNQWNMHATSTKAGHLHVGQDRCLKCQSIIDRITDAVVQAEDHLRSLGAGAAQLFVARDLPDDITAALADLDATIADAEPPAVDLTRKPWREAEVIPHGRLTRMQQNSLNRWYGHCHNLWAEHVVSPDEPCGGCAYLHAELRNILQITHP